MHLHSELEKRDKDVNEFEEEHNVKATQTNYDRTWIITTMFFIPEKKNDDNIQVQSSSI